MNNPTEEEPRVELDTGEAQPLDSRARKVVCKVTMPLAPRSAQTARTAAEVLQRLLHREDAALRRYDLGSATVSEPRTLRAGDEAWVSIRGLLGADRIPAEEADVVRQAFEKLRARTGRDLEGWQLLEYLAAEYLGGP